MANHSPEASQTIYRLTRQHPYLNKILTFTNRGRTNSRREPVNTKDDVIQMRENIGDYLIQTCEA